MATKGKNRDQGSLTMSPASVSFGPDTKLGLHREWGKINISMVSLQTELAAQSPAHTVPWPLLHSVFKVP